MIINYFDNSNQISTIIYHNDGYISKRETFNYNHYGKTSILYKKEYYNKLGLLHRFNKPALICYYKNGKPYVLYYYINGKLHNSLGPAIIAYKKTSKEIDLYFYLNGYQINKNTFFFLLNHKMNL